MNIKCHSCGKSCDANESYILALILNSEQFKCNNCDLKEVECSCDKLGVNLRNSNGNLKTLKELLQELSSVFKEGI